MEAGLKIREKTNKAGLGFTAIPAKNYSRTLPQNLDQEIDLTEMGVSGKARIFGVRHEETYYIIWLDRNHEVWTSPVLLDKS